MKKQAKRNTRVRTISINDVIADLGLDPAGIEVGETAFYGDGGGLNVSASIATGVLIISQGEINVLTCRIYSEPFWSAAKALIAAAKGEK